MITLTTYKELQEYITAFGKKQLNLLIVVSRGGLGKTYIAEEALMEEGPLVFSGHVTPMRLYKELYERNQEETDFICVFDDVDALMLNKTNVALLKQICDTREEKTIKYCTTSAVMGDTPKEFVSECKVLMLMNSLKTDDKNLDALLTRAQLIYFNPPDVEIVKHIKTFGSDKEITKFIELYAPFSKTLNLRVYSRAKELKASALDWKSEVMDILNVDPRLMEIQRLLEKYGNSKEVNKENEKKFMTNTESSRPTYYRFKKLFLEKNARYAGIS